MTVPWTGSITWVGTDPWPGPDSAVAASGTAALAWTVTLAAAGATHGHLPGDALLAGDGTGLAVLTPQPLAVATLATT